MPGLVWSEALSVSMPAMDATHQEFVELLAAVQQADDASLMHHWQALIAHTQDHFAREDKWMRDTGFATNNCHGTQHAVVLQVLREGTARGEQGELAVIRQMADELAMWFPQHAQTMDFGLALHLKSLGYDPDTGEIAQTSALPRQAITGCGGTCGTTADNPSQALA